MLDRRRIASNRGLQGTPTRILRSEAVADVAKDLRLFINRELQIWLHDTRLFGATRVMSRRQTRDQCL
jgi:hypothetical protein